MAHRRPGAQLRGALVADPNDSSGNTLYVGTGEGNRCSSGCEAGVGIYKTTNGGNTWTKLPDACVSNTTNSCANSGDAFLGRGINSVVVDPTNPKHLFVGSALAVRGLSHVIGLPGETQRFEPGANPVRVYQSTEGGKTFTEVWNGNGSTFGVTDVGLDPLDPTTITRPLEYDETLTSASCRHLRPHRRGRLVDLVAEVTSRDEVVWRGVSTYLAEVGGDESAASEGPPDVDDLATRAVVRLRFAEDAGRRYASVSGDVNPIHLHALSARAFGFDRAIAHGMFWCTHRQRRGRGGGEG